MSWCPWCVPRGGCSSPALQPLRSAQPHASIANFASGCTVPAGACNQFSRRRGAADQAANLLSPCDPSSPGLPALRCPWPWRPAAPSSCPSSRAWPSATTCSTACRAGARRQSAVGAARPAAHSAAALLLLQPCWERQPHRSPEPLPLCATISCAVVVLQLPGQPALQASAESLIPDSPSPAPSARSFAVVIQQLPEGLRDAVCVFYLVLRALDTVEVRLMPHFPAWIICTQTAAVCVCYLVLRALDTVEVRLPAQIPAASRSMTCWDLVVGSSWLPQGLAVPAVHSPHAPSAPAHDPAAAAAAAATQPGPGAWAALSS